jgi:hypothetical protein
MRVAAHSSVTLVSPTITGRRVPTYLKWVAVTHHCRPPVFLEKRFYSALAGADRQQIGMRR